MIPWLRSDSPFPPLDEALDEPNGLLTASADVTPGRLLDAYRHGIFPWYAEGQPVLWWSPNPRMVLFVDECRLKRSLRKAVRQQWFEIRVDSAFRDVMHGCAAAPRRGQFGTWITPAMIDSYSVLFDRGNAHSVEAWRDGQLAGGLYGVAIGRMFFGESMFARSLSWQRRKESPSSQPMCRGGLLLQWPWRIRSLRRWWGRIEPISQRSCISTRRNILSVLWLHWRDAPS